MLNVEDSFQTLNPVEAHDGMVNALRQRSGNATLSPFVAEVPHSLKLSSLVSKLTSTQRNAFSLPLTRSMFNH